MIGRQHRFHGHNSLKLVYARSQSARSGPISLKYASRDPRRPHRIAVVVSKKVHKSAVVRNRIRRRIYEIIRASLGDIAPGKDLIFTAYDVQIATMEAPNLKHIVNNLLQKST